MTAPSELETATNQDLEPQEHDSAVAIDESSSSEIAAQPDSPSDATRGEMSVNEAAQTLDEEGQEAQADEVHPEGENFDENETGTIAQLEEPAAIAGYSDVEADEDADEVDPDDELPDEVEMSLFDHLEELRQRIFVALIAVVVGAIASFAFVRDIVRLLEVPAQGVKFLQLAPGEFFFVSIKVAGYSGILLATPVILYEVAAFVLPGLTRKERRLLGPVVFGSSILFVGGLIFAYVALIPAALNFFITYGADVVEQSWSIEKYFDFVLLLMLSTGLAFQVPIIQALLGALGIVSSQQMLAGWKFVLLGSAIIGAVLTPSTDPLTQGLLGGAMVTLYFGGIGLVKLLGK